MMKILNWYISKKFVLTFIFAIIALSLIFIIVNLFEQLDKFIDRNVPPLVIALYYIYGLPSILKLLIPIATLLATLFSVGTMANNNEITAMKSGTLSLYNLFKPLVIITLFIMILQLFFATHLAPISNQLKSQIEKNYLGSSIENTYISSLYIRDNPTRNITITEFNSNQKSGYGMQIYEFELNPSVRLRKFINVNNFHWDSVTNKWILHKITTKNIINNKILLSEKETDTVEFSFDANALSKISKPTEQMNIFELYEFLLFKKNGGEDIEKELTDFYGTLAFPFANFIVLLFGVPFASVKQRGGMAVQIGAALIVSTIYMVFTKVGQTLGYATGFSPLISAWLANGIFLIIGLFVLAKTPK